MVVATAQLDRKGCQVAHAVVDKEQKKGQGEGEDRPQESSATDPREMGPQINGKLEGITSNG